MGNLYDTDIVAWATQQAALLREGAWSALDIANIAEEIDDVGRSEKRELSSRLAVLLSHLLKWKFQPELRGNSWRATIAVQRRALTRKLAKSPSLKHQLSDHAWLEETWDDALTLAIHDTGLLEFPDHLIWTVSDILDPQYFPD